MADIHRKSPDPSLFPELQGHGLRLTTWDPESEEQRDAWFRGLTDPDFVRWNTPLRIVRDRADALQSLRSKVMDTAKGTNVAFRITDAASDTTLGQMSVNMIDHVLSVARVGYWVLPETRGQGVATRALAVAAHWALTDLVLHRLELGHALGHEVSCKIAERCGFRYEGTMRGAMFESGRQDAFRDAHLHARIASDPEPDLS
ncbi:GNAT family N-acetyltransferase [Streptomyces gibsoniae]|uniref:GNAT family N-acetyltransferase n=1 Tax=Streptomyces gibsoniae TaxID=3075529 RepID=A0ABU2TTI1_9ACTN|nr:GNAT family N-acetyltransferase [Streptomyces sp. DSM 41699]MDT0464271.1 GNAT family N-acetyltransferase [Streptomyces sp. DSM 41699]